MFKKIFKTMALVFVFCLLLLSVGAQTGKANQPEKISLDFALAAYSKAMNTDTIQENVYLTDQMQELVLERRVFYKRLLEIGAHSNLVRISSEFVPSESLQLSESSYELTEKVTLTGRPILQIAKDYPPYQAYLLAAKMTDEPVLSHYLQNKAVELLASVQESIDADTFETVQILRHVITVDPQTGWITSDSFSSEANDDPRTDWVEWVDGKAVRVEPDLTQLPDYTMYQMSIEVLAEEILEALKDVPLERLRTDNNIQYSGSIAATYAQTWTAITPLAPCAGGMLQDMSNWNSAYVGHSCADCANYVSQALHAGGMPTDSTWQPESYAWINVSGLQQYIISRDLAGNVPCGSLTVGDLDFVGADHAVIVTETNPIRYSAHTSDRLNHQWQSSINVCMSVY